ncbi:MAG: LacI family DNA-binding transcriptional regulator, partial [Chthoniobacterales bacterium]
EGFVDGIITGCKEEAVLTRLSEYVPVVLFNAENRAVPVDCIIPDVERAIFEQMHYLSELGHRHIACYRPLLPQLRNSHWQDARIWLAFRQFYASRGLDIPECYLESIQISPETNNETAHSFVERVYANPETAPTAIITADVYASYLLRALGARGLEVPCDVSLIGYDDDLLERGCPIALTSYRQDFTHMAKIAIETLFERLAGDRHSSKVVEVRGTLVHRSSVTAPRSKVARPSGY